MYSCSEKIGSNMPMKMVPMNAGDEKQHQRLGERHGGLQVAVQVAFGDVGDADQFAVELAAFLGHGNHFQHGAGEQLLAVRQALAEPAALLHALDGLRHGIHENLVADGFARDVQALHQRHARAEQRAQHPAEPRHGKLRDQRPDQRRLQHQAFPRRAGPFPKRTRCAPESRRPPGPAATNKP